MPIEFRCSQCGKLLRTGDDTAGRQAQCPECGAISAVPSSTRPSEPSVPPVSPLGGGNPFGAVPAAGAEGSDNPYQSPAPAGYLPPGQIDLLAAQRVSGPATALIVTAISAMVLQVLALVVNLAQIGLGPGMGMGPGMRHQRAEMFPMMFGGGVQVVSGVFGLILAAVILIGAMKMKKLENYAFAMAAAILAMVPCFWPCCLLGLPFGIWALVVLGDGSVKAAFRS
jgi:phage FluMu protein Com